MCILSVQLLNGCQQKSKSVSGEEFSEIEERLRDTMSRLSAMEQERDELAQQNYDLKQQVWVAEAWDHDTYVCTYVRTYIHGVSNDESHYTAWTVWVSVGLEFG